MSVTSNSSALAACGADRAKLQRAARDVSRAAGAVRSGTTFVHRRTGDSDAATLPGTRKRSAACRTVMSYSKGSAILRSHVATCCATAPRSATVLSGRIVRSR